MKKVVQKARNLLQRILRFEFGRFAIYTGIISLGYWILTAVLPLIMSNTLSLVIAQSLSIAGNLVVQKKFVYRHTGRIPVWKILLHITTGIVYGFATYFTHEIFPSLPLWSITILIALPKLCISYAQGRLITFCKNYKDEIIAVAFFVQIRVFIFRQALP